MHDGRCFFTRIQQLYYQEPELCINEREIENYGHEISMHQNEIQFHEHER